MNKSPQKLFLKLINGFDLATSLFRCFELSAVISVLKDTSIKAPILDLGCAEGHIANEIFENKQIFGLDNDLSFLKQARNLNLYSALIAADIRKMPFQGGSFDFLFSNSVLEHIQNIELVFKETEKVLRPGGLFLFTVSNDKFLSQLFFYKLFKAIGLSSLASRYSNTRNRLLNHHNLYSQDKWKELINSCGLQVESMHDYVPGSLLMIWDFIAAIQKFFSIVLFIFLKLPIIKQILFIIGYLIKVLMAYLLLPFFVFFNKKAETNCVTLIKVVKK